MNSHRIISRFLFVLPVVLNGACKKEGDNVDSHKPTVPVAVQADLSDHHGSSDGAGGAIAVDQSLIVILGGGDREAWNSAIAGMSDAEVWAVVEEGYRQLKGQKNRIIGTIHAKAKYSKVPPTLVSELYNDFPSIESPEALRVPLEERGWGMMQEIVFSPKYEFASVIMGSDDPDTLAKVWKGFPDFSETDQQIISMAADKAVDLIHVPVIAAATSGAKSEEIKESLLNGANRVVAHALKVPEKREAAIAMARELDRDGLIRPLLLDAMKRLDIERAESEQTED